MQKFDKLSSKAAPLPIANIDTDMIIPKQFLKTIKRTGLSEGLFYEMRYDEQGNKKEGFVLDQPEYEGAQVLVAGENFGCGSSREHAPWAILDQGIRCVIAPSFADIFYNNCFKNGILPIALPQEQVDEIMEFSGSGNNRMEIDLPDQTIKLNNGKRYKFDIDPFRKHCLLNALDDIGLTLAHEDAIATFEQSQSQNTPWLYGAEPR